MHGYIEENPQGKEMSDIATTQTERSHHYVGHTHLHNLAVSLADGGQYSHTHQVAATHSHGEQGHAYPNGVATHSQGRLSSLAIVQVDIPQKEFSAIRVGYDFMYYTKEQIQAVIATSPLTHRTYQPHSLQTVLPLTGVRWLIL